LNNKNYLLYYWVPATVWAGLILFFGSPYGVFIGSKVRHFTYMSYILKGFFHIGEFAILTVLVLIPLSKKRLNLSRIIIYTVVISFGIAVFSEFFQFLLSSHQAFEWMDLVMNSVGIGIVLPVYIARVIQDRSK